jgi:Tfp pilus assembly PilM family ATPase
MELLKFFTRDETIAGIEIKDAFVRAALISKSKKDEIQILSIAEEALKAGTIKNGVLSDRPAFIQALKNLSKKSKKKIKYVIISIPPDNVYSQIFTFPTVVKGERLEETMRLIIGFQLPRTQEDAYLDWEKVNTSAKNEVFLALAQKSVIDNYIDAFEKAGLKVVAVETHPLSIGRIIDIEKIDNPTLVIVENELSATIMVIKHRTAYFARVLPYSFIPSDKIPNEIKRIVNFYESENKEKITQIIKISGERNTIRGKEIEKVTDLKVEEGKMLSDFTNHPEVKKRYDKWIVSVGTGMRGLIPRSEDTIVSLLSVGTEEAYRHQKTITFVNLISDIVSGISIFFMIVFIGAWLLMTSIQENLNKSELLYNAPLPADMVEVEARAKNLNTLLAELRPLVEKMPLWSKVVAEIKDKAGSEIFIINLSLPKTDSILNIRGLASDRSQLSLFKKSMEDSPLFTEITMPLTSLEQKNNIPFSISFKLKDASMIYINSK